MLQELLLWWAATTSTTITGFVRKEIATIIAERQGQRLYVQWRCNTATPIVSWNMLEGTLEGVDGGLLLKTIEKHAQWIGFMRKVIQIKQKSLL